MKTIGTGLGIILATLFMGGCAAMLNSDRPRYSGPIVKPVWSIPHLAIDKPPVIHDGIAFVQPTESGRSHLYAFEAATGKQLWTSKFTTGDIRVIIGPRLMVTDDQGLLHSVDTKTGGEIGQPESSDMLSAAADGNMLYVIFKDRSVAAFDRPGHILWKASVPMNVLFDPVVADGNVSIYGQSRDAHDVKLGCGIRAFDAATGALRWKWDTEDCTGPEDSPITTLTADAGAVYIRIDTKTVDGQAGMVLAFDAATGKQKWSSPTVQFQSAGPILLDASTLVVSDNIPGDHGGTANRRNPYVLRGLDRATGQMKWEIRTSWKYESWTARNGLLFIADRMAHALTGTGNTTSPDSFLTVTDIRTGRELWRSETVPLGSFTTPAVGNGMVIVGSLPFGDDHPEAAGLFAFRADSKDAK